ncbi:MAG: DUF5680 domain-containing protein [Candidatus Woesearchaeota archaeon]
MNFTNEELAKFLVKAKIQTYAGEGKEVSPQRPGFKELEYFEGDFEYRDSYCGFFSAPGQEIVRFRGEPIWAMSYNGGMIPEFRSEIAFASRTYQFLKLALSKVEESKPYRGPAHFEEGNWVYRSFIQGDITLFNGRESIFHRRIKVYEQTYMGGLIVSKNSTPQ